MSSVFCILFSVQVCVCVWAMAQVSQRLCRGTVAGGVAVHPQGGGDGWTRMSGARAFPWGQRRMPPELRFGALINEPASARTSVPGVLPCVHTLAHAHCHCRTHILPHMQRQCALALHTHTHTTYTHLHTKFARTKKDALKGPRPSALALHPPTTPPPLYDATKVHGQYESP